jgi:hypothetical protein
MIRHSFEVTPDDDNDLSPEPVKAVMVSAAGDVALVLEKDGDSDVRIFTLSAGVPLTGFASRRVKATGTTATGIVALY